LSADTLRQIQAASPDVFCLCDSDFDSHALPRLVFPEDLASRPEAVDGIPPIPATQTAVRLYTSGSTGSPVGHDKTWGYIVRSAHAEAERLGITAHPPHIVGTVPAQHSYGFESTVMLALHAHAPFWAGKPFYPQDIVNALAAVPQPRLLVTTPFHLAALLSAGLALPPVDRILSATAPLSSALAARAEAAFGAPLYEIYGSTETGQIASRQTTADVAWQLLPGVVLRQEEDVSFASGGHIEREIALSDRLELRPDGRFLLHGRHADLVNIAGKRTSLAYLNHQICAIPGVSDAAFFLPDDEQMDGITRLAAFVVAPGLDSRQLLAELRQRIDSIFLPRPLVFLPALPRNSTGKLPRSQLAALFAARGQHDKR
jgi:acyl-coenzyme A synthetase/AMP-(fatty) acid ligase